MFSVEKRKLVTSCISVKIKYTNFDTHSKQKNISFTASDQTIRNVAFELLRTVYERRMRLRLIGISFNKLVRGKYQINLFDDSVEKIQLYQAMDRIKTRFNPGAVQWGSGLRNKRPV